MRRRELFAAVLVAFFDYSSNARLGFSAEVACWPAPPGSDPRLCPPNDREYPGLWNFFGFIPRKIATRMHPKEAETGAIGMSIDIAWQHTIGRDDVVIAVLDSGIRWGYRDLTNKLYLNRGELPLPDNAASYDANGDGIFNIQDYATDSRVGDLNGNQLLDPQDLILKFSDKADNDQNGYVDDISGYDFFVGDSDPHDDVDFGHGTRQAASSAGEANNGHDAPGVCPRCRILPVRVGDSFVVDANRFACGVVFAVRSGATIIQEALGSLNNTPTARAAVDFAYQRGVPIIASAADEYSYHHNFPGVYNHTAYVNSIRFDHVSDFRKATTFWGINGCTNYGARVWVTVPGTSCSSEATSRLSGVVGLIQSAARDAKIGHLSAEETYQVLRSTATDLVIPEWDTGTTRFPAREGYDQYHGYGRVNAANAVRAVQAGLIPPEIDLKAPDWFHVVSPKRSPRVSVIGTIRHPRATRAMYQLDYALGVEPRETDYISVANGAAKGPLDSALGTLDFSTLPIPGGPAPLRREDRDRYSVTLRLRATDERSLVGETRRSFFVFDDPTWKEPFPLYLGASGEVAPILHDLDRDGDQEIILPTADGLLRIYSVARGVVTLKAIPFDDGPAIDPFGEIPPARETTTVRSATVGDILGYDDPTVVVGTREGKVYAFDAEGNRLPGFPVSIDPSVPEASPQEKIERGLLSKPVLANLDGVPGNEIIVSALDGHVYAWRGDGSIVDGFPVPVDGKPRLRKAKLVSTPAVGDIDGDGRPEIVVGSNVLRLGASGVFAIRHDGLSNLGGPFVPGWAPYLLPAIRPELLPTIGTGVQMDPVLVDADRDGDMEVVVYAVTGRIRLVDHASEGPRVIEKYSLDPGAGSEFRDISFITEMASPLVADTNHDGRPELYAPLVSLRILTLRLVPGVPTDVPTALGGWDLLTGEPLPTYPRRMEDLMIFTTPMAADVDGEGNDEVLIGSGGYLLHAFRRDGTEAAAFPKFTGGWIFSEAAVGDIDGDHLKEALAVTREGYLFAWRLE